MESDLLLSPKDVESVSGAGLWSRWQSFSSVCLYVSIVGTTYAYGVYSELLRENLGFSQHGLDVVASVGNTGLYLSLLAGLALERFGLQVVIRGGGFLIFIGFLYIWAAVEGFAPANITSICVFFFLSQFGVCCHVSSSVTFAVRLFPPESRGIGVGLAKGYFGLSSAVLGDFAGGYFSNAPSSFLLFIALFIPLVGSVSSYFANLLPESAIPFKIGETNSMLPYVIHWMVLFIVILSIGLLQFLTDLPVYADTVSSTILMITLFSMVAIPGIYGPRFEVGRDLHGTSSSILRDSSPKTIDKDDVSDDEEFDPALQTQTQAKELSHSPLFLRDGLGTVHENRKSSVIEADLPQYSLGEVVFMWRFWAMYLIFLTMTGVGLMVIYNINAIASSVGKNPSTFFVTLVALANGMGRVLAGFISDRASQFVSKLELFSIVILCMAITQALHSIGSPTLLYPCLLSVGFLFGCTVSLMAINIADIFGGLHIATIFGLIDSAAISGTVIFAAGIVYLFYKESGDGDDDYALNECFNTNCFRVPFIINATCCLLMFGLCLFVNSRVTPTRSIGH